jgi:hypothetical protein
MAALGCQQQLRALVPAHTAHIQLEVVEAVPLRRPLLQALLRWLQPLVRTQISCGWLPCCWWRLLVLALGWCQQILYNVYNQGRPEGFEKCGPEADFEGIVGPPSVDRKTKPGLRQTRRHCRTLAHSVDWKAWLARNAEAVPSINCT